MKRQVRRKESEEVGWMERKEEKRKGRNEKNKGGEEGRKEGRKERRKKGRTDIEKGSREESKELKEGRKREVSQAQQGNDCMLRFPVIQLPNYMIAN